MPKDPNENARSLLDEGDEWDATPLEDILEQSEPVVAVLIDTRKPKKAISLRVDPDVIDAAKKISKRWGLGYQTLFRVWILEGMSRYCRRHGIPVNASYGDEPASRR